MLDSNMRMQLASCEHIAEEMSDHYCMEGHLISAAYLHERKLAHEQSCARQQLDIELHQHPPLVSWFDLPAYYKKSNAQNFESA